MRTLIINSPKYGSFTVNYDDCDHEIISKYNWHIAYRPKRLTNYCATTVWPKKTIMMHRMLCPEYKLVDHKDGNGLNNCRSNLRSATGGQNVINKHTPIKNKNGYRGLNYSAKRKKYVAYIGVNGKLKNLGGFNTKEEAAKKYNEMAIRYFGEFAILNQIP